MFKHLFLFLIMASTCHFKMNAQTIQLPNGWSLSPAGKQLPLGDLPLNLVISPNKKWLAVTNNGQSVQSLQLVDAVSERISDSVVIPKSWYGLHFSGDSRKLYASGGNDNCIRQYKIVSGKLLQEDSIVLGPKWPEKISPAGIELDESSNIMYVVTKENNALYVIDLNTRKTQKFPVGSKAYTCLLSKDKKTLFISAWESDKLLFWNTVSQQLEFQLPIGDNPNELLLSRNQEWLYVANANDNSVAVVNIAERKISEVLNAALYPNAPNGSTTNGLALSSDGKTLYVANADNNCLAVFDVSVPGNTRGKGFIPTGWYPTNVKVLKKKIWVTNGKGLSSMANPFGPNPVTRKQKVNYQQGDEGRPKQVQYIGGLFRGTLSVMPEPGEEQLAAYTSRVYANSPYRKDRELAAAGEKGNPVPMVVGDSSPIKHVFYIIKENRTYDQVLGDLPMGNGDTGLVLFGKKVTPNQHAIAESFVLLDNFYVDAEVSADGHNWSTAAYANDYTEKTWPTSYGGRGGTYDYEGQKKIAHPKGGFIWDHCLSAGISYRSYGEFADNFKANIPALEGKICRYFTSWDESVRDTTRVSQWKRDFDSLVAANALPAFNTIRLINDHTEGMRVGRPTPFAHVADNDYAVGLLLEHLSHSAVWNKSVLFVLEDDAQNGPDHVDAHRSTAYIAGPFVKRKTVDHTMYSTSGMLRTIELILGLPPMSQYDAAATPMWRSFTAQPDFTPFQAISPLVDLNEKNVRVNEWSLLSESFDFSGEDRAPDLAFSEVIWKSVKGETSLMPAPRRGAFIRIADVDDEEEADEKPGRRKKPGDKRKR